MKSYSEKLRDPRWQKKRLKILERDDWTCQNCLDTDRPLNVHHKYYIKGCDPWEYPPEALVTLCEGCHVIEKEGRAEQERQLLQALRLHFFTEDIDNLAQYFNQAKLFSIPSLIVEVLGWFLYDKKAQLNLIEQYREFSKKRGEG